VPPENEEDGKIATTVRGRWMRDLQTRRGYRQQVLRREPRLDASGDSTGVDTVAIGPAYLGSPDALLVTANARSADLDVAVTFEKDAGEPVVWRDTAGVLGHALEYVDPRDGAATASVLGSFLGGSLRGTAGPFTLYLGDYTVDFGRGLAFGGAFGGFKGSGLRSAARGIRPSRSAVESGFLRGAALEGSATIRALGEIHAAALVSLRRLDATTEERSDGEQRRTYAVTIDEDGTRRTRSDLARAGSLEERLIGARADFRRGPLQIGATGYLLRYDLPIAAELPFEFSGDHTSMLAVDAAWSVSRLRLSCEVALARGSSLGMIAGVDGVIGPLDLSLVVRALPATFYTPYGYGFGESPRHQRNEKGIYGRIGLRPSQAWRVDAYCDLYRFPERTRTVPLPRSGIDAQTEVVWRPLASLTMAAKLRNQREDAITGTVDTLGRAARPLLEEVRTGVRVEAEYRGPKDFLRLRGDLERKFVSIPALARSFGGTATSLDIRLRPVRALRIGLRLGLFDVDQADAAIILAEQELPGRVIASTLSGRGRRFSLYVSWKPLPGWSVTARYGETVYADRTVLSPGDLQQIDGPEASSVGVQVQIEM
jgi:hypothetical protein